LKTITQQPSAIADSGSDSTLLRHSDAVAAQLDIELTTHPLQVQFPDGKTARSTVISDIALPATAISLPLFSISDITKQNYSATFHKNGLYLYHDKDLVHFISPKTTEATAWTLPIQRTIEHANKCSNLSPF
jgi:hypothetical protein